MCAVLALEHMELFTRVYVPPGKKIFILEFYSFFFTSTSLPFSFVFFNGLHYTYLPILHLSLVLQGFLKVEHFVSDLQLFPRTYFCWPKISNYYGNYQEARKNVFAFSVLNLRQCHHKWPQKLHKNYIQDFERSHPPPCHSFLSILVSVGGDRMAVLGGE